MTAVLQRILKANVIVGSDIVGSAERGLLILLGVASGDTRHDAELLAAKIVKLRIFGDDDGKMNLSLKDIGGEALVVSNFTLLADYRRGNRPDYLGSARPEEAAELYEYFVELLRGELVRVGTGVFGAHMEINVTCDGPVTIVMESDALKKAGGVSERNFFDTGKEESYK